MSDILVALVTCVMLKDIPIDRKIQQDAGTGVAALQRGAASGFLSATALLNADRGILLVEDEVLALPDRRYRNNVPNSKSSQSSAGATTTLTTTEGRDTAWR